MAIIYSYPKVTTPLATDVLVLTDTTLTAGKRKNKTKSLALSDLASYVVSSTSAITGSGTINTIPMFTPSGVEIGDSLLRQDANSIVYVGPDDSVRFTGTTINTPTLLATNVFTTNITSSQTGVVTIRGNAIIGDAATDVLQISSSVSDYTGTASTAAGEILVSTANGQLVWAPAPSSGSVTGTGTTNTLPIWTDGPNGVLGDSPISSINSTNSLKFVDYTAIAVATTESLTPNQSNQAPTEDTLAILSVDPDGNVVRGSQEGTWTFTKAQLDTLGTTTATGNTLIQAPGADKAVIVEESNWMVKYSGTGAYVSDNSFIVIQSSNITNAEVTRLPSGQIDNIMAVAPVNPSYGFYSRDLPLYNLDGRTYKTNEPTKFIRVNTTNTPTNLVSISIKLKYRVFDTATF